MTTEYNKSVVGGRNIGGFFALLLRCAREQSRRHYEQDKRQTKRHFLTTEQASKLQAKFWLCGANGEQDKKNAIFSKITFLTVRPRDGLTSRKPASFLTTETTLQGGNYYQQSTGYF